VVFELYGLSEEERGIVEGDKNYFLFDCTNTDVSFQTDILILLTIINPMNKYFYLLPIFIGLMALNGCKKDTAETAFDNIFYKPYSTGIIKFEYQVPTINNGISTTKDTTVNFTSIGNNPSEKDDYGYSEPSMGWVQVQRLNIDNFENRAIIGFAKINLNSLILPFTFKKGEAQEAGIDYVIGFRPFYDTTGNLIYGTNTYYASTYSGDFELTLLSRVNNRLQGTYTGLVKNQDGLTIFIKKGLFDIEIVER